MYSHWCSNDHSQFWTPHGLLQTDNERYRETYKEVNISKLLVSGNIITKHQSEPLWSIAMNGASTYSDVWSKPSWFVSKLLKISCWRVLSWWCLMYSSNDTVPLPVGIQMIAFYTIEFTPAIICFFVENQCTINDTFYNRILKKNKSKGKKNITVIG